MKKIDITTRLFEDKIDDFMIKGLKDFKPSDTIDYEMRILGSMFKKPISNKRYNEIYTKIREYDDKLDYIVFNIEDIELLIDDSDIDHMDRFIDEIYYIKYIVDTCMIVDNICIMEGLNILDNLDESIRELTYKYAEFIKLTNYRNIPNDIKEDNDDKDIPYDEFCNDCIWYSKSPYPRYSKPKADPSLPSDFDGDVLSISKIIKDTDSPLNILSLADKLEHYQDNEDEDQFISRIATQILMSHNDTNSILETLSVELRDKVIQEMIKRKW